MIGRDRELSVLVAAADAAAGGRGDLWLLAGDAGVGKTTLADAVLAASGLRFSRAVATPGGSPYAPIAAVLRQLVRVSPTLFDDLDGLRPSLSPVLPELGSSPTAGFDQGALREAFRVVFERAAEEQPTVVVLDDVQWADAATVELLSPLAEWTAETPLLVLAMYRADEIPRGHPLRRARTELRRRARLRELAIEPFDESDTARLTADVIGGPPCESLQAALYDRTQGIPFLIVELADALRAAGALVAGPRGVELAPGEDMPLPESIRDVIRMRLDARSDDARSTLEAAAVCGPDVDLALLSELGEDVGLAEAIEHGVLAEIEPGSARFRHDLTREAIYADTHWPRRRDLHRRVATLLEARAAPGRSIAAHWLAAGETRCARPVLLDAAIASAEVHAYRDAISMLTTALETWSDGDDVATRQGALRSLGRYAQRCGELAESARAWEELVAALADANANDDAAHAHVELAAVYELLHSFDKAVRARVTAAEQFAAAGDHVAAAKQRLLAGWRLAMRDTATAGRLAADALASARLAARQDLEARSLSLQGFVLGLDGQRSNAEETVAAALGLALRSRRITEAIEAHWVLGTLANHWGDYRTAEAEFMAGASACSRHGIVTQEVMCRSCLGIVLYNRGRWDEAAIVERDVLASDPDDDAREHALVILGLITAARGGPKRARALLNQAAAIAGTRKPDGSTIVQSTAGLALVDELEGVDNGRWRTLVESPPAAMRLNYALWARRAATFGTRQADRSLVARASDVLGEWASRFGTSEAIASFAHALGELSLIDGESDAAADQFGRAGTLLADMDAPFEHAVTQTRAGAALAASGQRDAAVENLVEAYRTFRRVGARPFWVDAAASLKELGEAIDRRLGRRAGADLARGGLTRREMDVLALVAAGHTNRAIADELVVSTRTIDMHVRNLLTKLGARSRTEAVAKARKLALLA